MRNGTLYLYGAINLNNIGYVSPYGDKPGISYKTLNSWIAEINSFAKHEISDYIARADKYVAEFPLEYWVKSGGYERQQPGSRLVQYSARTLVDGPANPSVLCSSFLSDGQFNSIDESLVLWLKEGGVSR